MTLFLMSFRFCAFVSGLTLHLFVSAQRILAIFFSILVNVLCYNNLGFSGWRSCRFISWCMYICLGLESVSLSFGLIPLRLGLDSICVCVFKVNV